MDFLLLIVLLLVFLLPTFFLSRQQRKRQQKVTDMQAALQVGDRVVTAGGLHGAISALYDSVVDLEVAPGVVMTFERSVVVRQVVEPEEFDPNTPIPGTANPATDGEPGSENPQSYWDQRPDDEGYQHPENRQ